MPGLNAYKTISSPVSVPEQGQAPEQGQGQAPEQAPVSQQAAQEAVKPPVFSHNRKKQRQQQ
jgi:hypothetical protein